MVFERQPVLFAQLFGMGDKKALLQKPGAVGALKRGSGMRLSTEETHRRRRDNGSGSRAVAQKSAPIDRNLATAAVITAHRTPACIAIPRALDG
jgi:hypothetical protein